MALIGMGMWGSIPRSWTSPAGSRRRPKRLQLGSARVEKVSAMLAHAEGTFDQVRAADREVMADAVA